MNYFKFNEALEKYSVLAEKKAKKQFEIIDGITEYNQTKVLNAFIKNRVSEMHLGTSTGYGYGDVGRDTLDQVFADCMGAEDAIVRHSFASGTHTLTVALFGILRPGDKVLVLTGRPYDTIIGRRFSCRFCGRISSGRSTARRHPRYKRNSFRAFLGQLQNGIYSTFTWI